MGECVTVEVKDKGKKTWLVTASDERQAAKEVLAVLKSSGKDLVGNHK